MLDFLRTLLHGRPLTVSGTSALPEGEARKVALGDPLAGGKELVLCRVEGALHALDAACPHEGGRISAGRLLEGRYAVCPLHGYKFDPKNGQAVGVACRSARTYPVRESGADCRVWA
jgi:3-phenylpropionate/trans-cinnamate dioxygenase ferredoxin subunit